MGYCDYWKTSSDADKYYHDNEWGVPLHDDRKHFEFLTLESMQCGLSWKTIINKREIFKKCFADYDYDKVAKFTYKDIDRIMNTGGMIKAVRKIKAIIHNAQCFNKIRDEFGTFSDYIWKFSDRKTILYDGHDTGSIPASNALSETVSKDLKKRGFKFVGAVTIYSYLQSVGIINDHDKDCPRYDYINSNFPTVHKRRHGEK